MQEQLYDNLFSLGYPVAYDHFTVDEDNPPPTLPFICYKETDNNDFLADNINYQEINTFDIELYTEKKEPSVEKLVKDKLKSLEIVYDRSETYIDTEKMYQVVFTIQI